jgi:hypothetical protein
MQKENKSGFGLGGEREHIRGGSGHRIGKFSKVEQVTTCMRRKTKLVPSFEKKTKVWHVKWGQARLTKCIDEMKTNHEASVVKWMGEENKNEMMFVVLSV